MKRLVTGCAMVLSLVLASLSGSADAERTMDPIPGKPRAADFELQDPAGDIHRLSDYRDRVVLVNFWATWCAPCREEMPAMDRLYRELRSENLEILAVHAGRGGAAMEEFLAEVPVSFPVLIDAHMNLGSWGVVALPTTVLVDRNGHRRYIAVGPREWDSPAMVGFLRERLREAAPQSNEASLGPIDTGS